jgi:beta-lactamase superfamily II metal-dependent hydrolase
MYEVDFLPVGKGGRHGDAIALRFTRPDTGALAHVIIDAGFDEHGEALVDHVRRYYRTTAIDIALVSHPDADHIGGMGHVIRELEVTTLCIHRLRERGGDGLPAADAVDELIELADENGTQVREPFAGTGAFGGGLRILGPTEDWYGELVAGQQAEAHERAAAGSRPPSAILEAARRFGQQFLAALPVEVRFDDAGGTNPRNNTSAITLVNVGGHRILFTADAGVPALERAWDWAESNREAIRPDCVDLAHHGSRHNASSAILDRILGPTSQAQTSEAIVSVGPGAKKHPSPRVANAFMRRGYGVYQTAGKTICHRSDDAPHRAGWTSATPLEPLDEHQED